MQTDDFTFDAAAVEQAKKAIEENEVKSQNKEFIETKIDDKRSDVKNESKTAADAKSDKAEKEDMTRTERILKKFKNPQELAKAYVELEREFSRRSMRLKELEKSLKPYESEEEWKEAADKFFQKTPSAKPLAKDIAREIALDPTLKEGRDCFDRALVRALAKAYRTPEQMMSDGQFLEKYVFGSDAIREAVIARYLRSLDGLMPPVVMLASGGLQLAAPPVKPRTVREAGSMFLGENK